MPGVFSAINTRIQGSLVGKNLKVLSNDLPDGQVTNQEGRVTSVVVPVTNVYISGKYDLLIKNSDGSHTLVDLKISQPDIGKIDKYKTQLNAYMFALENPDNGDPIKITKLALLIFYPDQVLYKDGDASLTFPPKWLDVPLDQEEFVKFIKGVDKLLNGPMPEEGDECKWCKYRHLGEELAHLKGKSEKDETIPF